MTNKCEHIKRYVENGRVWCSNHCGWSERIDNFSPCPNCGSNQKDKDIEYMLLFDDDVLAIIN